MTKLLTNSELWCAVVHWFCGHHRETYRWDYSHHCSGRDYKCDKCGKMWESRDFFG